MTTWDAYNIHAHVVKHNANSRYNVMFHSVAKAEIVIQFAKHLTNMYLYFISQKL